MARTPLTTPVEEQMSVLMKGVEYGDANLQATMESELRSRLAEGRPLRVYCGFDPTAVDLHLGHLIPMLKLRQFQRFGHEVVFLIGTMTGTVGDPSDKTAARQMLTQETVEANAQTWLRQAYRVLDSEKTVVQRNGDWLSSLTFAEVVDLASNFTVSQFLDHETYRRRLAEGKPLYLHEFMYALMQAYDALVLKTDVQVGGVEQLFNILAGRQLQRTKGERPLIAVCLPILIGTDGNLRMSKSTGNYIGLDDPPADMYGKVMSIPDSLLLNYYTLLTDTPVEELKEIERSLSERAANPMELKKRLARQIVALLYGEEQANTAQAEFERVFQRREEPEEAVEISFNDLPFMDLTITSEPLPAGWTPSVKLATLLSQVMQQSVSAARRLIDEGAVQVDGEVTKNAFPHLKPGNLIRAGRHTFIRIVE